MNQNDTPSNGNLSAAFSDTTQQIRDSARQTAARVKEQAAEMAQQRKAGLADKIDHYRESVEKTANDWQQEDPNLAWLTQQVSQRLGRASEYVRNTDFDQMHDDAADIARRHPALFFGGLFLGGIVLGNLLKAGASSAKQNVVTETSTYPDIEDVGPSGGDTDTFPSAPSSELVK